MSGIPVRCWGYSPSKIPVLGLEDPVVEQDRQHACTQGLYIPVKNLVYFRILWGMKESFLEELVSQLRPEE